MKFNYNVMFITLVNIIFYNTLENMNIKIKVIGTITANNNTLMSTNFIYRVRDYIF